MPLPRRPRGWPPLRAVLGHRPGQALAVAALAALVTAGTVLGPLYQRAMLQAATEVTLAAADAAQTSVLIAQPEPDTIRGRRPPGVERLATVLPDRLTGLFGPAVGSTTVLVTSAAGTSRPSVGNLQWTDGACAHVVLVAGRCPDAEGEVLVSTADATTFGLTTGSAPTVLEQPDFDVPDEFRRIDLRVVGVYRQQDSPYWAGQELGGLSGYLPFGAPRPLHDTWLTARETFSADAARKRQDRRWTSTRSQVSYALRPERVGVDELLSLGPALRQVTLAAANTGVDPAAISDPSAVPATVRTGLPGLADVVRRSQAQAEVTVPLLLAQVDLLGIVVLWLVLGAVLDQRRPEIAVARLSGLGPAGARRLLFRELLPIVGLGVVAGVAVAFGLSGLARRFALPGAPPFEVPRGFGLALLATVVLLLVVAWAGVQRLARDQLVRLLRRVPARRTGWRPRGGEAVAAVAAATVVAGFATGSLRGPAALLGPAALALAAGLVLAQVTRPLAARLGGVLVRRGRGGVGVGTVLAARRPVTGLVVVIVTVAAALSVFTADTWAVAQRNWRSSAQQEVGAAAVVPLRTRQLGTVRRALAALPPDVRRHVTPVVRVPGTDVTLLGVVPREFRRISFLGDAGPVVAPPRVPVDDAWAALAGEAWPRVTVRGGRLSVLVAAQGFAASRPRLQLDLVTATGRPRTVGLGRVGREARRLSADVPCAEGCDVIGVRFRPVGRGENVGRVTLTQARAPGGTTDFPGYSGSWRVEDPEAASRVSPAGDVPGSGFGVTFSVLDVGAQGARAVTRRLPAQLPVILAGTSGFAGLSIDGELPGGQDVALTQVGVVPRIPGGETYTALADLDVLTRSGSDLDPDATAELWLDTDAPAVLASVREATAGVAGWGSVRTYAAARQQLGDSVPAWSLRLGLLVALAGLLISGLVVVVVAITTWRLRSRDLAALRMAGVPRRSLARAGVLEQVPPVLLGVAAGVVCGWLGARLALPLVPLFLRPPLVSTLDLVTEPGAVAIGAVAALVAVGVPAYAAGRTVARRAGLDRLRDSA